MMKWKKIFRYIIDNFDMLLTIILAVVTSVISTFNGKINYAIAATSSVLAVLAISILRDRDSRKQLTQQIQDLQKIIKHTGNYLPSADNFFSHKTDEREIIIRAEQEIVLIQETGRLIAETLRRELVTFLKKGGIIRWISVLDSPCLIKLMAFRNANLTLPHYMERRMQSGVEMIEVLSREAGPYAKNLEVRYFPYPVDITAVFRDPTHIQQEKREALIRLQGFRVTYDDKLDFKINALHSAETFNLYRMQMEQMWHHSKKCLFITGTPGIGKSTLLSKVVSILQEESSLHIEGVLTRDRRNEQNERIGFETRRISSLEWYDLASKSENGRYFLNQETMEQQIIPAILEGAERADLLIIDEVGPIQLQHPKFAEVINTVLEKRNVSILGIVALKGDSYLEQLHQHYRIGLIEVTELNRDDLVQTLLFEFQ